MSMKKGAWEKKAFVGNETDGKTVGIVGYGRIGQAVGRLCKSLGMEVIYTNLSEVKGSVGKLVDFDTLLALSDIITIHAVLTDQTKNMFNASSLARMKKGSYLLNLARGPIVDEQALYDALKSGQLAGAAIDVYWQEPYTGKLLELDNVILTPHIGASTKEAQLRIGGEIVQILKELKL